MVKRGGPIAQQTKEKEQEDNQVEDSNNRRTRKESAKEKTTNSMSNRKTPPGRGSTNGSSGRGASTGGGNGPEQSKRKRDSPLNENDQFEERHEKNMNKLYAVWDKTKDIISPTKFWKKIKEEDRQTTKAYIKEELMGEGESIHNMCRIAFRKKPLPTGELHSVEFWIALFNDAHNSKSISFNNPESHKLRTFAARLCQTNKGHTLISRQDTVAWTAARKFMGDVWNGPEKFKINGKDGEEMDIEEDDRDEPQKPAFSTLKDPQVVTPGKSVLFKTIPANGQKTNNFFLSREIRKKQVINQAEILAHIRKSKVFMKTKLPKVTTKDDADVEKEVVDAFNTMVKRLMYLDKKTLIFPWNERNKSANPLSEGKMLPSTRAQMEVYVDRVFIQYNKSAYCRVRVGFDEEEESFFGDRDWFSGKGYWYEKDDLQVKITANAGWFVGSSSDTNMKDLAEAIRMHPLVKKSLLPISIRIHAIRIEQGEKFKTEDMIKAVHVYGDYNKMSTTRSVLRKIYKGGIENGFPLGIKMRFIPNIADPRYPVTVGTKSNVKILRGKQKSFLKNIRTQKSHTIQGLDFYIEQYKVTLRQVIMGMRSAEDEEKSLFISVEDDGGTRANFVFHKKLEQEARHMITVLPIMLEHIYGSRIWTWFTDEAKAETSGWIYNVDLERVVSPDENYTLDMITDWDDDSMDDPIETETTRPETFKLTTKIVLDKPAKNNHYNDNGSVKTLADLFKRNTAHDPSTPPQSVVTDNSTKEASLVTDSQTKDTMTMAKEFIEAMKQDKDIEALLRAALENASPVREGVGDND